MEHIKTEPCADEWRVDEYRTAGVPARTMWRRVTHLPTGESLQADRDALADRIETAASLMERLKERIANTKPPA